MKFKVGDKVRIRKDLISGTWFRDCSVTRDMCEMGGKEAVIRMARGSIYFLSTKGTQWAWTDEMLEAVNEEVEEIDKPEPAETPLAEREEEKRYWLWLSAYGASDFDLYRTKGHGLGGTNLNVLKSVTDPLLIFTESEIAELDIDGFEKVEVPE